MNTVTPPLNLTGRGDRRTRQHRPVRCRRYARRGNRRQHRRHPDHDREFARAADHIAMRGGIAECTLDSVERDSWIGRQHVFDHRGDPGGVTGSIGHQDFVALFRVKRHGGENNTNCGMSDERGFGGPPVLSQFRRPVAVTPNASALSRRRDRIGEGYCE